MANQDSYISVIDLDFIYPDGTQALIEINLEIAKGEFIALIGQNGSGKTTLSKCLNGLYKPTSGDIIVDGLNSKDSSIGQMVKRVGYVHYMDGGKNCRNCSSKAIDQAAIIGGAANIDS